MSQWGAKKAQFVTISPAPPPRPVWGKLTIILFLGLLWLPTLDYFFKLDHARAPVENRLLAKSPQLQGLKQTQVFLAGVENYFNDHFGFRKRLIRWNHHWKRQLFHDSGSQEVLLGREGWMFYSGCQMVEHCRREMAWTPQELEHWRQLIEMRRDWLQERGIKYLFVLAPDKHSVYPEYLPEWLQPGSKPSKVEQLVDYMKAHSTVEMLDLRPSLIQAKQSRVDYLTTDTHWNLFGGFVAYRAMLEALGGQLPGLAPLPPDVYEWKLVSHPGGDLATLMGNKEAYPEKQAVQPAALRPLPQFEVLYDSARFPHPGAAEFAPRYTFNDKASGKAIFFRDSFANSWFAYLGQHFKEVIYIWHYEWDRSLIEREKPDVVIDEMVERFFNLQDPVALACKDQSSGARTNSLQALR